MSPTARRIETAVWLLIYGGLIVVGLGLAVQNNHGPIGWTLVGFGALAAAAGVMLIWVRSRINEDD